MGIGQRHGWLAGSRRLVIPALALLLAGCQAPRPDFTARSRQDCARGDQDACRMLEALVPPAAAQPQPAMQARRARPTPVQADVQAIMRGIEQAKLTARTGHQENLPPPPAPHP
jgi:hypothetical protein